MGIYTTIDDVKRLFKTNRGTRVKFAENAILNLDIKTLKHPIGTGGVGGSRAGGDTNFSVIFRPNEVSVDPDFSGYLKIFVYFDNSTDYRVFESSEAIERLYLKGASDIATGYIDPGGKYEFTANAFGGVIQEKDMVVFDLSCDIGDSEIEAFIYDAEVEVDNHLISKYRRHTGDLNMRIFTPLDVPDQVSLATAYLAAYRIYTTIFIDQQRELEKQKDVRTVHFSERWKRDSDAIIASYTKISNRKRLKSKVIMSNKDQDADCVIAPMIEDCAIGLEIVCKDD